MKAEVAVQADEKVTQLPTRQFSLAPRDLEQAMKLSTMLADSELVPKDYRGKPANVLVAVQWGAEVGLQPLQALQNIAVINGRPSLWGDAVWALVKSHHLCEFTKEEFDQGTWTATCTVKRKGNPTPTVVSFSKVDAEKAQLWNKGGSWAQYPKRMLQMRARAFACRDAIPEALKGLAVAEEVMDYPPERDVTDEGSHATATPLKTRLVAAAKSAGTSEALSEVWKKGLEEIRAANDKTAYEAFKNAVAERGAALKAAVDAAVVETVEKPAEAPATTNEVDPFVAAMEAAEQQQ